jgi:HPt (histidine-containing phosphotransfer) domain-containing protein
MLRKGNAERANRRDFTEILAFFLERCEDDFSQIRQKLRERIR